MIRIVLVVSLCFISSCNSLPPPISAEEAVESARQQIGELRIYSETYLLCLPGGDQLVVHKRIKETQARMISRTIAEGLRKNDRAPLFAGEIFVVPKGSKMALSVQHQTGILRLWNLGAASINRIALGTLKDDFDMKVSNSNLLKFLISQGPVFEQIPIYAEKGGTGL